MQKHRALKFFRGCIMCRKGRHSNSTPGEAGYTLMELMIALFILAVGVMGIWSMQGVSISSNATARKVTDTAALGSDQLEKLMRLSYDNAMLAPGTTTTREEGNFKVTWTVSNLDEPIANMKTVTVTASWIEAGQQRKVTYVYYKANEV